MAGDIKFEEPQYGSAAASRPVARQSWLTTLVVKTGLARDAEGAQRALLVILALAILGIIAVWTFSGSGDGEDLPIP